jgi:hypothetical protein
MSKSGLPEALKKLGGSGGSDDGFDGGSSRGERKPVQCENPGCRSKRVAKESVMGREPEWTYGPGNPDILLRNKHGGLIMAICQKCYADGQVAKHHDQLTNVVGEGVARLQARTVNDQLGEMLLERGVRPDTNPATAKAKFASMVQRMGAGMRPSTQSHYPKPSPQDAERPWGVDLEDWNP